VLVIFFESNWVYGTPHDQQENVGKDMKVRQKTNELFVLADEEGGE
jgi:hypothetical protein